MHPVAMAALNSMEVLVAVLGLSASHDLRQPMQSLFLFAAGLRTHIGDHRGQRALDLLERNLASLKGLMDSLLDLSRLEAAAVRPAVGDVSAAALLDEIGASFAPVARAKGLDFVVHDACPAALRSDRHLLGRIVRNLVENAIKDTERGRVELSCHAADGHAVIEITDTGIGIPDGELEAVFDEFHRVDTAGNSRTDGTGLGLSIVKRLSEILGHPLSVTSALGQGSVFRVTVPLAGPSHHGDRHGPT